MLIVTGSDDRYAIGVMMLIASAALHNPTARFAVLDLNISEENRARIADMAEALGIEITRYEISADRLAGLPVVNQHINVSSYLRLLIPEIFPQVDKLVYMDSDMLCTGPLSEAYEVELGDHLVAAVKDPSAGGAKSLFAEFRETGVPAEDYINAGFLVMNVALWRAEGIHLRCMELIAAGNLLFEDQSAINIVCKGRKLLVHEKFNFLRRSRQGLDDPQLNRPCVIHYTGKIKPWADATLIGGGIWLAYAERFKALLPPFAPITSQKGLLERWNYQRKLFTYRFTDPDQLRRLRRLELMERNLVGDLARLGQGRP